MVRVVDTATNQIVANSPELIDADNDDQETWNWTPTSTGTFEFTCIAW